MDSGKNFPIGYRSAARMVAPFAADVYMLTESASHYYEMMTKHGRMPVLIGQTI